MTPLAVHSMIVLFFLFFFHAVLMNMFVFHEGWSGGTFFIFGYMNLSIQRERRELDCLGLFFCVALYGHCYDVQTSLKLKKSLHS